MGQCHQVYVRLPNKQTIGIHHKWLFGERAVKQLINFLTFVARTDKEYFDYNAIYALFALYSINMEDGYVHRVHNLDAVNPIMEGNNNGITVIDLLHINNPRYCFASISGLECLDDTINHDDIKNHTPMGYKEWILLHYPNYDLTQFNQFFRDYSVMSQTTYDEIIKR